MAREPRPGSTTQSISIGGSAAGVAQVAGDHNTITATGTVTSGTPPEVLAALAAIQAAVSTNAATKALADAAAEQANAKAPDKATIAQHLQGALTVAKTLPDWLDIAKKIGPAVATAAAWLGAQGAALLALAR